MNFFGIGNILIYLLKKRSVSFNAREGKKYIACRSRKLEYCIYRMIGMLPTEIFT